MAACFTFDQVAKYLDDHIQVGNYVEQFDLAGNYQGEWPGWYNWPDEMVRLSKNNLPSELNLKLSKVMGPRGELVVSALGAMDDQHMLAPGLVTYRSISRNKMFEPSIF